MYIVYIYIDIHDSYLFLMFFSITYILKVFDLSYGRYSPWLKVFFLNHWANIPHYWQCLI